METGSTKKGMIAGSLCLPVGLGEGEAPDEGGPERALKGGPKGMPGAAIPTFRDSFPQGERALHSVCLCIRHGAPRAPGWNSELRLCRDPGASLASCGCSLPPSSPSPCAAPSFPPALGTSHMLFPLPRIFSTLSFFFPYPNFTQILSLNVACLSSAPAPLYSFHAPYS